MRSLLLAGGLAAVLAAPTTGVAQTRCERDRQTNQVAGTVVGAGIGALLGSAVAGRHSGTTGAVVGGVAGAVAGNQLAKRAGEPCPPGYYEVPTTAPAPPPAAAAPAEFWRSGPAGLRERIDFMESRVRRGERDGVLTRNEADRAYRDLGDLRRMEIDMRRRDGGGLSPADRDYLQERLDDIGARVRWARRANAYNAYPPPAPAYNDPGRGYPTYNDASRGYPTYSDPSRGYYDSQGVWRAR